MERSPLVLIHGFTATPVMWEPVSPLLEEHHELFAPIVAGHCGGSLLGDGVQCSIAALADQLESQLDAAGIDTAHLVGNSLGGWLALELAVRGRARSVVALSPAGGWERGSREERRLKRFFLRVYHTVRQTPEGLVDVLARRPGLRRLALRDTCANPERFSARQARDIINGARDCSIVLDLIGAVMRDGPADKFEGIEAPVRIAWAERDRVLPRERHEPGFRRMLPDAEFTLMPGVGHCPMADDPSLVARTILEVTAAPAREPAIA